MFVNLYSVTVEQAMGPQSVIENKNKLFCSTCFMGDKPN